MMMLSPLIGSLAAIVLVMVFGAASIWLLAYASGVSISLRAWITNRFGNGGGDTLVTESASDSAEVPFDDDDAEKASFSDVTMGWLFHWTFAAKSLLRRITGRAPDYPHAHAHHRAEWAEPHFGTANHGFPGSNAHDEARGERAVESASIDHCAQAATAGAYPDAGARSFDPVEQAHHEQAGYAAHLEQPAAPLADGSDEPFVDEDSAEDDGAPRVQAARGQLKQGRRLRSEQQPSFLHTGNLTSSHRLPCCQSRLPNRWRG
jgi:hypothetical protein